jgi:protein-S-isoprenylcysteine O-methyltransferase Ste14
MGKGGMQLNVLFLAVWVVWAISWIVAALWSRRTEAQLPPRQAWTYRILVTSGALLLLLPRNERFLGTTRLWHIGFIEAHVLLLLTVLGIAFTWWARIWLGPLWSSAVTRKEGHIVVDTGPYALVRHPIYTGILLAAFASGLAKATALGLCGVAVMAFGLWVKARYEENFLSAELPSDAYGAYRKRVPMLVPFLPPSARK